MSTDKQRNITRKICFTALFTAIAYVVMILIRIKPVPFLTYDPKDAVITVFGFMFGPVSSIAISIIVPLIEMLTASDTGIIGFLMNALASVSFVIPATVIYKYRHKFSGAVLGLFIGIISLTTVMLLFNILITPLYTSSSRDDVIKMIPTLLLPFNLLKGVFNSALVMLLYKPITVALKKAGVFKKEEHVISSKKFTVIVAVISLGIIAICSGVYFMVF